MSPTWTGIKRRNHASYVAAVISCIALSPLTALMAATPSKSLTAEAAEQLFAHQIWPTFTSSCLSCHGDDPEKLKGGLDLRTRESAIAGGDYGSALTPSDPNSSPLLEAIRWTNEDLQMPPKESERLSSQTIDWIEQWIAAGAPWPDPDRIQELVESTDDKWSAPDGVQVSTSGGLKAEWTQRRYLPENLWAYQPLVQPPTPRSSAHPIDAFIESKLDSINLSPAPPADRRALIRRTSYDLLGLPPTPEAIQEFLSDPRPDKEALAHLVEQYLASPHYGEQWGRHWLDVVRYADTSGFANDFDRGNAWRYRDYVIRSFNQDKPYSQFITEQIAGDELDPNNPEHLVAVGFLRMGPWELTGMEVPAIARQRFLDDVVNGVGQSFLGHTLRCAKCHDHKFDPVPTRDYYSFYTTFNTTQLAERRAAFLPEENTDGFEEKRFLEKQKRTAQTHLDVLNEKSAKAVANWFAERNLPYRTRAEAQEAGAPPDQIPPRRYGFTVEDFGRERIGRKTLGRLAWKFDRYQPIAFSVYSGLSPKISGYTSPQRLPKSPLKQGELEAGHILMGGDAFSPADAVSPGALSMINSVVPSLAEIQFPDTPQGRRTALAKWITHPDNPLTYRAIVNRIWQWHFGQPIAGNPNNLGASGKKPTHPKLLDWLAVEFRKSGGSFKAMHRLIMTSDAYQRSTDHPHSSELDKLDPTGTHYAAFRTRRLTSEELRDSMLFVSGELNPTLGGIPNRPEINLEVALQPRMVMGSFATAWQPNPRPSERHRRSIYALKVRGLRDPFMEVFNEPDPDLSCEARDASNVTPQVFSLFNSQIAYDRAVAFANRIAANGTTPLTAAIASAFHLALGRSPSEAELKASLEHHAAMLQQHQASDIPTPDYPVEVLREAVEENTGEKFEFRERLHVFEEFVPDAKLADLPPQSRALAELCLVLFNTNEFAYVY